MQDPSHPEHDTEQRDQPHTSQGTGSRTSSHIRSQVKEILTSPFIAEQLVRFPAVTNIILILLLSMLGFNVSNLFVNVNNFNQKTDYTIKDTQNLCRNYQKKLHLATDDYLEGVDVLKQDPNNLLRKPLFECLYKIRHLDGFLTERKLKVQLNVVDSQLTDTNSSQEYSEEIIDMKQVCIDPKTYKDALDINLEEGDKIYGKKPKLLKQAKNIWPIFRWQCEYTYQLKKEEGGFSESYTKSIGLDLIKYCKDRFPEMPHASHKDYNDPYSLYCTNPHP